MKAAGFAGGLFAIFVPPASGGPPPDFGALMAEPALRPADAAEMSHGEAQPVALTMAGLLHWMARAAPGDFRVCRSVGDIRAAMAAGAIAGVMHMEGAEAIGPDLDALHLFHDMGLRSLGPVWSRPTIFGHGVPMAFPGTPDIGPGLTATGKDLVRLCDALGIMIDLSHMNAAGLRRRGGVSTAPLVATHSNAHALCDSPRNLTDRQLHMIRERGGMVGFNFATFYLNADGTAASGTGWDVMLRHLDHLIAEAGEDHVGLGSDFDGCMLSRSDRRRDRRSASLRGDGRAWLRCPAPPQARARQLARLPRPVPDMMPRSETTPRSRPSASRGRLSIELPASDQRTWADPRRTRRRRTSIERTGGGHPRGLRSAREPSGSSPPVR
jgi:membrane dipeptidase